MPDYKPDNKPDYLRVIDEIQSRIDSGRYRPGERLPTIRQLAEEYGVTVGTMRHALDLLKDRGKLVGRQGVRVFVAGEAN